MPMRSVVIVRKETVARTWYGGIEIPDRCSNPEKYVEMNMEDVELSHLQDEEIISIDSPESVEIV